MWNTREKRGTQKVIKITCRMKQSNSTQGWDKSIYITTVMRMTLPDYSDYSWLFLNTFLTFFSLFLYLLSDSGKIIVSLYFLNVL